MDLNSTLTILQESIYLICVFFVFLAYAMMRGKQSLINLILALYLALLISLQFPYYDRILSGIDGEQIADSTIMIIIFALFTLSGMYLFGKLMPRDIEEPAFEGFGKKVLFALLASVLVMIFSYHALPVTDIITPGSPIQALFGPEEHFFWWLLVPLMGLFFL